MCYISLVFSAEVNWVLLIISYWKNSTCILQTVARSASLTFDWVMDLPTNQESPESLLKPLTLSRKYCNKTLPWTCRRVNKSWFNQLRATHLLFSKMDVGCDAPKPLTNFCVCGVFVWLQSSGHIHTQLGDGCRDVQPTWVSSLVGGGRR